MLARFRSDPLIGNIIALTALFIALGGVGYAAVKLPNNSVKSKHIKDGQVKSKDVRDDTLVGADIDESQLGEVAAASNSDKLDGEHASGFLRKSATAANSLKFDGKHLLELFFSDRGVYKARRAFNSDLLNGLPSTVFAQRRASTAWTPLELNDGAFGGVSARRCHWKTYQYSGGGPPGYYIDQFGVVHLKGLVRAVNGFESACGQFSGDLTIASFDPDLAPDHPRVFATLSNEALARVNLTPGGELTIQPGFPTWTAAKDYVSLDGISFTNP